MRPFRYTREEERGILDSSFEPHDDGYVFYRNHWARGISVTAAERAEYLRPSLEGSRTAFYRKIKGRAPIAPRRPWLRSQAATLRAIPAGVSIGLVAIGGTMLARSGGLADHGLAWLLLVAGAMAVGYGTLAFAALLWSRARACHIRQTRWRGAQIPLSTRVPFVDEETAMRLLGASVAVAILGTSVGAGAQQTAAREWVRVNGDDRVTAYVDRRSIRRNGDMVRFDGRIVYVQPDEEGVKELLHSGEISCARRDYRIIGFEALDEAGTIIATHVSDDPATAINDDSPNAALHAEFCG